MAERAEIAEEIEALAVHCRPPLMSLEDRSRWLSDWCEDLQEYSIDAIQHACRKWRMGTSPKFPMLGQLVALIKAADHQRARGDKAEAWRPLSDAEYRGLTVREKIRHHQILAHQARTKAGPMWEHGMMGRPLAREEMPEKWHDLHRLADGHDAEVRRLRAMIRPDPEVVARQAGQP